jgi:hypothetical protein
MGHGQRAAGQTQDEAEDDQSLQLMTGHPLPPDDFEREPPVQRRVRDRREQQAQEVGTLRACRIPQDQEQGQVHHGAEHPDGGKAHQLTGQPGRYARCRGFQRGPAQLGLEIVDRQFASGKGPSQPRDPTQVGLRSAHDVYLAVRVVDPVDRDFVDA